MAEGEEALQEAGEYALRVFRDFERCAFESPDAGLDLDELRAGTWRLCSSMGLAPRAEQILEGVALEAQYLVELRRLELELGSDLRRSWYRAEGPTNPPASYLQHELLGPDAAVDLPAEKDFVDELIEDYVRVEVSLDVDRIADLDPDEAQKAREQVEALMPGWRESARLHYEYATALFEVRQSLGQRAVEAWQQIEPGFELKIRGPEKPSDPRGVIEGLATTGLEGEAIRLRVALARARPETRPWFTWNSIAEQVSGPWRAWGDPAEIGRVVYLARGAYGGSIAELESAIRELAGSEGVWDRCTRNLIQGTVLAGMPGKRLYSELVERLEPAAWRRFVEGARDVEDALLDRARRRS